MLLENKNCKCPFLGFILVVREGKWKENSWSCENNVYISFIELFSIAHLTKLSLRQAFRNHHSTVLSYLAHEK